VSGHGARHPGGALQRFIIRFAEAGRPEGGSPALRQRLREIATAAGVGNLEWQRRLGVGADLVTAPEPLDPAVAERLLRLAAARPDVDYAEADSMASALAAGRRPAG